MMLPDPAQPDFVTFCGVIGAFVGVSWARWTNDADRAVAVVDWTYLGVSVGLVLYLGALVP